MYLLSLKALVFNTEKQGFFSPQRRDFIWPKGIVVSHCERPGCQAGIFDPRCTCGIYSSPNPNALDEYATAKNSVFVLLNLYKWADIWSAPDDIPNAHVLRAWGAQIVGIVGTNADRHALSLSPARSLSAAKGAEFYEVELYQWPMAKKMIEVTWSRWSKVVKNPYLEVK